MIVRPVALVGDDDPGPARADDELAPRSPQGLVLPPITANSMKAIGTARVTVQAVAHESSGRVRACGLEGRRGREVVTGLRHVRDRVVEDKETLVSKQC